MIVYKCDMCGQIHESIGDMISVSVDNAGILSLNPSYDRTYTVCKECGNKLLKILNMGKSRKVTSNDDKRST